MFIGGCGTSKVVGPWIMAYKEPIISPKIHINSLGTVISQTVLNDPDNGNDACKHSQTKDDKNRKIGKV